MPSLSNLNHSNSKAFHQILPRVAPVCEGLHYHKTGVPWQMNKTLIIVLFLFDLSRNALFCKDFRDYGDMLWNYRLWWIRGEFSKLLIPVSHKIGNKTEKLTTKDFLICFVQSNPLSVQLFLYHACFSFCPVVPHTLKWNLPQFELPELYNQYFSDCKHL